MLQTMSNDMYVDDFNTYQTQEQRDQCQHDL